MFALIAELSSSGETWEIQFQADLAPDRLLSHTLPVRVGNRLQREGEINERLEYAGGEAVVDVAFAALKSLRVATISNNV